MAIAIPTHPSNDSINHQVVQETYDYGDILLQDFYEHYTNLSVKSVMMLKFISEDFGIEANFLFKVLTKSMKKHKMSKGIVKER